VPAVTTISKDDAGLRGPSPVDPALACLALLAGYFRIGADPVAMRRDLGLSGRPAGVEEILRSALRIGLKARAVAKGLTIERLSTVPVPSILERADGDFVVFGGRTASGEFRLVDPLTRTPRLVSAEDLIASPPVRLVLVQRRLAGPGVDPATFGFRWFLPSIWRYRKPLAHVLLASFLVQIFALVTPLFFQVVVDKVLVHRSWSTLTVLAVGLVAVGVFDVVTQFLRGWALSHTTNRIDVELGRRLFAHLLDLPLGYFETRSAGQTVARMRELETIRAFLTGQGLFSGIDLVFTLVFVAVLFVYSWQLTLIVVGAIPIYLAISAAVRPALKDKIQEKFNRGAASQQFLVEAVVGIQTLKAAAVEPMMRADWEEKLAAYVKTSFEATQLALGGQNAIQWVSKLVTAGILYFGATAVIEGRLTVGELVAFNMIAGQVVAPVLRLSQLWQDFQQIQVSVERLGDILNTPHEPSSKGGASLPPPRGGIRLRDVSFRYRPGAQDVLRHVTLDIRPGEVIGIVGPSGSGKSTLTKLVQRLYLPHEGQILVDGVDIAQVDPSWLRRHIGVVLQENLLFNRSIHGNVALSDPALPRAAVMRVARLAGADEFVSRLPEGYDTMIEERGANLSGGQRQRLAIARALSTDPPILILDEATSALDYESERIIQTNMRSIVKGRTVIIIAHRLAAVRNCDRIVGMRDGRIVEVGRHDELVARPDGLYARLWALQNAGPEVVS
jgi:subfamily B ATP-binding cassette protein HlyB/CyaB